MWVDAWNQNSSFFRGLCVWSCHHLHRLADLALLCVLQERQRLETILSLCAEYTKPEGRLSTGTTVADVQKINKELEKLQLSDEESVFEEALVCPDARYRCHQKGSLHDADLGGLGNLSQSSASLLAPRSMRNDELLGDLTRTPPPPTSAFLKAASESSYLSILPKVMLWGRDQDSGPRGP